MTRSERQEAGTRSGVGTLATPGTRPRPPQAGEAGQGAQDPRRARSPRPVPPQRPVPPLAGAGQRPDAGAAGRRDERVPSQRPPAQRPAGDQRAGAAPPAGGPGGAPPAGGGAPRPGLRRRAGVPPQAPPAERGRGPRRYSATGPQPAAAPAQTAQPLQEYAQDVRPAAATRLGSGRMPFVVLLCGLLGGALVCALVISTTLAEGSFQISSLQTSTSALAKQQQALEEQVAQAQSPQQIGQRATELGMRRVDELRFLDLTTGKVTDDGPTWSGAVNAPGYAP